jgi:hypothetical protein
MPDTESTQIKDISPLARVWRWFVEPLSGEITPKRIWLWWEKRRPAYNLVVVLTAVCAFVTFYFCCATSGKLHPGEDPEEPVGVFLGAIVGPVLWNLAYCLGPSVEIILRKRYPERDYGPWLLKLGVGFSVVLICFPAVCWALIWIGQALKGFPKDY